MHLCSPRPGCRLGASLSQSCFVGGMESYSHTLEHYVTRKNLQQQTGRGKPRNKAEADVASQRREDEAGTSCKLYSGGTRASHAHEGRTRMGRGQTRLRQGRPLGSPRVHRAAQCRLCLRRTPAWRASHPHPPSCTQCHTWPPEEGNPGLAGILNPRPRPSRTRDEWPESAARVTAPGRLALLLAPPLVRCRPAAPLQGCGHLPPPPGLLTPR